MERKNVRLGMIVLLAGMLLVAMVAVNGCKKSTPAPAKPTVTAPAEAKKAVAVVDANKAATATKAAAETAKTAADASKTAATEAAKTATEAAKTAETAAAKTAEAAKTAIPAGPNTPK
jgi:hypothetical protein